MTSILLTPQRIRLVGLQPRPAAVRPVVVGVQRQVGVVRLPEVVGPLLEAVVLAEAVGPLLEVVAQRLVVVEAEARLDREMCPPEKGQDALPTFAEITNGRTWFGTFCSSHPEYVPRSVLHTALGLLQQRWDTTVSEPQPTAMETLCTTKVVSGLCRCTVARCRCLRRKSSTDWLAAAAAPSGLGYPVRSNRDTVRW